MTTPCPNVEASTQRNNSEYHSINMDNPPMNEEVLESSSQETRKEPLSAEGGDPARLAENKWVSCMKEKMLFYSGHDVPDPYAVCIYKVPEKLLKANEDAYSPRTVSIGPFHHGKPHLQAMERYKWRCLDRFLKRPLIELQTNLNSLIKIAMTMEIRVRACYHDTFDHLTTQEFSEMVMLDGIFIVELFLENDARGRGTRYDEYAVIFDLKFMKNDILHDMLLLENQLPLFVLQKLFSLLIMSSKLEFYRLAHEYFKKVGITDTLQYTLDDGRHLLDYLKNCHLPDIHVPRHRSSGKLVETRTATKLHEVGVNFSNGGIRDCLFEVTLDTSEGMLTIPQVIVNEWTHAFFGNLIAFEQCGRGKIKEITSYIILMDSLIDSSEDVNLLVKAGIIKNLLGDNKLVADLFNNLYKETVTDSHEFFYAEVCEDLNEYSRDYWRQWKATLFKWKRMLRENYFSNPWSTISVIAAVILLALTAVQTACSIVQI